jgi:hypothetical protein
VSRQTRTDDRAEDRRRTYYYAVKLNRWVIGW